MLAKKTKIFINGKFLTAPPTGVHRVAEELITALDKELSADPALAQHYAFEILAPNRALRPLHWQNIPVRKVGVLSWQLWEQFELPIYAHRALLLNLCNLAPLAHRNAIVMVHDAQVYLTPTSYSTAFREWYRFVLPRLGRHARAVATVSDYSKGTLSHYGVTPEGRDAAVIRNGVDHFTRVPADGSIVDRLGLRGIPFVVALASLQTHKNIEVLLTAMARPEMAPFRLVLFGASGRAAFVERGYQVPENVVFAGKVSDGELRALFEQGLCLAFPSRTEGFGLPPLEAMSVGCPAVVAPCGALPEVCGEAVVYASPDEAGAWADAFLRLSGDPDWRRQQSAAAKAQAARFTWQQAARSLCAMVDAQTAQV